MCAPYNRAKIEKGIMLSGRERTALIFSETDFFTNIIFSEKLLSSHCFVKKENGEYGENEIKVLRLATFIIGLFSILLALALCVSGKYLQQSMKVLGNI